MSNVNLNLYRIFCKVAESKSYSDAADKLNLSVSNVSTQILNLEKQLNLKLFNRESKGVTLTKDGEELYRIVNQSISNFDFAEKLAQDKNSISDGIIKIGCPSHLTNYYLMDKIEKAKQDYPKLHITTICEIDNKKIIELLNNYQIDFAIIDSKYNEENIKCEELLKINNIFVSKTPLEITDIKELEDLNIISNLSSTKSTKELKEILQNYNVNIHSTLMSDATEVRVEAVKRNLGIAYVIKEAVKKELDNKQLFEVKVPIDLPVIELNLVYRDNELSNIDKLFMKNYLRA